MSKTTRTYTGEAIQAANTAARAIGYLKDVAPEALEAAIAELGLAADQERDNARNLENAHMPQAAESAWRRAGELDLAKLILRMHRDGALG